MVRLDRTKQRVVVEPKLIFLTKGLELAAKIDTGNAVKTLERLFEQLILPFIDGSEIDLVSDETGRVGKVVGGYQAVVDQPLGRDQQRITGKRREALIRRIPVAGRPEWQYLPISLLGLSKQIDELVRLGPEVPDAEIARQRGRMKQDA